MIGEDNYGSPDDEVATTYINPVVLPIICFLSQSISNAQLAIPKKFTKLIRHRVDQPENGPWLFSDISNLPDDEQLKSPLALVVEVIGASAESSSQALPRHRRVPEKWSGCFLLNGRSPPHGRMSCGSA
jgi:hypothetical protein